MKEYKININENEYAVSIISLHEEIATVAVNGKEYRLEITGTATQPKTPKLVQPTAPPSTDAHPAVAKTAAPAPSGGVPVKSPLPGVIIDLKVREGDMVKVGQPLLVLEAMKMENNIESDKEGIVKSIAIQRGDSVLEGDTLLIIA